MTPEEFRKIILPEGRRLYALAFRYLNSREEAEDAVQEAMMKLWEGRIRLDEHANHAAWCTTVTRNCCIDMLRKRKKIIFEEMELVGAADRIETGDPANRDDHEAAQMINRIVSRMKEPYRSAVILRDIEGYSYEEAAESLQTTVNSLRTILSRARKMVREEMNRIYSHGTR
jgi:RNA polymerase sigma factor (sigma-70 family)